MDDFNKPDSGNSTRLASGPDPHFRPNGSTGPRPNSTSGSGSGVTTGTVRRGRGRFLGFLGAATLAVATGVIGYTAAGAMFDQSAQVEAASPGDQTSPDGQNSSDGDGSADPGNADNPANPDSPAGGQTPVPGTAMTVEQANAAVVRIEATGEFADPEFGFIEGVGSGSGFIINSDGVAVTNNHVVAGAAFLEVFVPGEDRPRNARILATSECSDLAVIDIEGDGFPAVALNMSSPTIGTDVYAAGYPLGDPEFTLTKGIISKAETAGDTPLSSVDGVLEHDARINPGNSGGPLFDHNGQVVGVNYQGNSATEQSFAINAADAFSIIDRLVLGTSVDSIGINGQIVDLGDRFGLFVSSVETGSMADRVGLAPGDVILELENVAVSSDGTMGDYCDVLRTNGSDVPLNITVLRPSLDQILFGTLNGDGSGSPLNVGFDGGEMMSQAAMAQGLGQDYQPTADQGYQRITDDSNSLSVEVPARWMDIATSALGSQGDLANVSASDDLRSFEGEFVTGGLQLTAFDSEVYGFDDIWQARNRLLEQCATVEAVEEVDFGTGSGLFRLGHDCGPQATASLVLFQAPGAAGAHFASGIVQVVTPEDVAAAERALTSFVVA